MPTAAPGAGWTPFRPTAADLERIGHDVAPISDLQARLVDAHPDLSLRDRVAHQCQLAGGRVRFEVATEVTPRSPASDCFSPEPAMPVCPALDRFRLPARHCQPEHRQSRAVGSFLKPSLSGASGK